MKAEELYYKEFGDADSIPKESVIRLLRHFAKVLEIERNQIATEVERRIKERVPSEEERHAAASDYEHKESMGFSDMNKLTGLYMNIDFEAGADWACSRLTEINSAELSQIKQINATELPNKQEGGEG